VACVFEELEPDLRASASARKRPSVNVSEICGQFAVAVIRQRPVRDFRHTAAVQRKVIAAIKKALKAAK